MKKPYDDFDKIPALKDLTPWDSIHLEKHFYEYLDSFIPDRVNLVPYGDRHALWFGNEFAVLFRIVENNKATITQEGNIVKKRMIVMDGALISNGIETKEVLNANLKFKKCRRVQFDMRRAFYDRFRKIGIHEIDGVNVWTLYFGMRGDTGKALDDATEQSIRDSVADNRNVPEPLIKVADRPVASHRSIVRGR